MAVSLLSGEGWYLILHLLLQTLGFCIATYSQMPGWPGPAGASEGSFLFFEGGKKPAESLEGLWTSVS